MEIKATLQFCPQTPGNSISILFGLTSIAITATITRHYSAPRLHNERRLEDLVARTYPDRKRSARFFEAINANRDSCERGTGDRRGIDRRSRKLLNDHGEGRHGEPVRHVAAEMSSTHFFGAEMFLSGPRCVPDPGGR